MSLKISSYFFNITCIVITGFSFRETSTEPEKEPTVLMPLKVGNSWHYGTGDYDPDVPETYAYSIDITREVNIKDTIYYELQGLNEGDVLDLARNTDEGLYFYEYYQSAGKKVQVYFFKYPVEPNGTYYFFSEGYGECTVDVTKQDVLVPAGLFECYVYIIHYWQRSPKYYFCPNIGQIAYESTWGEVYAQLVSYTLN